MDEACAQLTQCRQNGCAGPGDDDNRNPTRIMHDELSMSFLNLMGLPSFFLDPCEVQYT